MERLISHYDLFSHAVRLKNTISTETFFPSIQLLYATREKEYELVGTKVFE
jgi:hypothetical protein